MEYGAVIAAPYFVSPYTTYTPEYSVASFVSILPCFAVHESNSFEVLHLVAISL
jgi:hypothetical protein